MIIKIPCPACGQEKQNTGCDGCGKDITNDDDALVLAIGLVTRAAPQYAKVYCADCAPKHLPPAALGLEGDLPAVVTP